MKRIIALVIIVTFIPALSTFAISKNEPAKKISAGLNNIVYGSIEIPDNINGTNSKGQIPFDNCTDDTKDDIGRGIVRIIGGLWQIATSWYPTE